VIDAPDVLLIDAIRLIPKPPYRVSPLDVLALQVTNTLPDAPIAGPYTVEPDGTIALGFTYGHVKVEGLTLEEVKEALQKHLKEKLTKPEIVVALLESRGLQQVRGQHLVRPDGTVGLGVYGSVAVDGMTIDEARTAIEEHLAQFVLKPEISLDVAGFNSKVYYIVTDGAGNGEQVRRLPMTGKTTVLDALSEVGGVSPVSSKYCVYLVRPTPSGCRKETEEVYKVEWNRIVRRGCVATNYQLLPGDRIYVYAAPLITLDTYVGRFLSPFERLFADVGLGNTTVRQFLVPVPKNVNSVITTPGF
jgi:polysaccharide export outer membrane protein